MSADSEHAKYVENVWRTYMETGDFEDERRLRQIFKRLPGHPRCKYCFAPFSGLGSIFARAFYGKRPSKFNPHLCNACEAFAEEHQGGAEIELSMLFVDVRGSTPLAESMTPLEYSVVINRFYTAAAGVLVDADALVDKLVGDQAIGLFVPGIAGSDHAHLAIKAAAAIMRATGHHHARGPWIPLGAGVHTGVAFVGSVGGPGGTSDITVLGDAANITARLSSEAVAGEILISCDSWSAAGLPAAGLEERELTLKGKELPVSVRVLTDYHLPEKHSNRRESGEKR